MEGPNFWSKITKKTSWMIYFVASFKDENRENE